VNALRCRYMTGVDNLPARKLGESHGVGLMAQPGSYGPDTALAYPACSLDNGRFGDWTANRPFRWERWWRWLTRMPRTALFATAPDEVGDAEGTLRSSLPWCPLIRDEGFKVAYAAQNGSTPANLPWGAFDVLFIGGDTAWKLGHQAADVTHAAHLRGLPVHMGRVNSEKRLKRCDQLNIESCDGNYLAWAPNRNALRLAGWLNNLGGHDGRQLVLA
jgi:hypothetical protein